MSEYRSQLRDDAIALLQALIATPSPSRQEAATADLLERWLNDRGIAAKRTANCVWALLEPYSPSRPTLMLNSHHDTVKPAASWSRDPYNPTVEGQCIYGLGSNDAGASVVSLAATFAGLHDCGARLPFNLLLALTAEEEVMGEGGMRLFLPEMERLGIAIDMAIVGEPTSMQPAVGERGLVVLDCVAHGRSGHAARSEGENALYKALDDIAILRAFRFPRQSEMLGPVKISVTQIQAGTQHNVVPDRCSFVVDVRTTDAYTNEQTAHMLAEAIKSDATPRSTRVRASLIPDTHPLVKAAKSCGGTPFVSLTTSDMALMPFPSLKIGPGESSRSHSADEYILVSEIDEALTTYGKLIDELAGYYTD